MTTDPPILYTTAQVAALLGISRQLVHRYANQLQIGTYYGNRRLFTPADLHAIRTRPDHRQIGLTNRWPAPGHDERP